MSLKREAQLKRAEKESGKAIQDLLWSIPQGCESVPTQIQVIYIEVCNSGTARSGRFLDINLPRAS